jgi:hypothetical protein
MRVRVSMLACLLGLAGMCRAQLNWFQPGNPAARGGAAMAFDAAANTTILFGGFGGNDNPDLGDTWALDVGGWFQLSPANSPPARSGAGMAYDAATKTLVLFGGNSRNGAGDLNDTWLFNGTTWTEVFPAHVPPARRWDTQGMAYHAPSGKVVLFGGVNADGSIFFGDTWTWDGTDWTQQAPAHSPSGRRAPLVYDAATGTVVLFGGEGGYGGPLYGDTWTWNGTDWRQRFPFSSPPARSMASMAYSASLRRLVLFGGSGAGSTAPFFTDTWVWDGINWKQQSPAVTPPERYAFGMVYDPRGQAVMLFGGLDLNDSVLLGDTWRLALAP